MEGQKIEIDHLRQDIVDIKVSLKSVSESLQRLTRLEERFASVTESIVSIERHYESIDDRVRKLENDHIYAKASARTLAMTAKIAWALGGGLAMTLITKLLQVAV